jgi:hypothetical protein
MLKISYTAASTARGCWKKYYWKYVYGLEPHVPALTLTVGKVVHECFDMFYKYVPEADILRHIENSFAKEIARSEDIEPLVIAKYIALGMWSFYPYKDITEYKKIYSEEAFEVPLCKDVTYVGKPDGRILKHDVWWIRELKVTGLGFTQFEGRASTSDQTTGYTYGLNKMGHDIKGIMYEYIRKPSLRKGQNETMDDFGRRCFCDYKTRPKNYYGRFFVYRSPLELELFEEDMVMFSRDLMKRLETNDFYRNTDQCWNFNAECPYRKICFTKQPDQLTVDLYFKKKLGGEK